MILSLQEPLRTDLVGSSRLSLGWGTFNLESRQRLGSGTCRRRLVRDHDLDRFLSRCSPNKDRRVEVEEFREGCVSACCGQPIEAFGPESHHRFRQCPKDDTPQFVQR